MAKLNKVELLHIVHLIDVLNEYNEGDERVSFAVSATVEDADGTTLGEVVMEDGDLYFLPS